MSCNNTNNTCTQCNHNYSSCNNKCAKCGCKDSFLTSPPPCPTPAGCPDPIPCEEVLSSNCIIYSGPDILCGNDTIIYSDSNWTEILENLVEFSCSNVFLPEILCEQDIVIEEGSTVNDAFEQVVEYFCDAIQGVGAITANNGLTMSTSSNVQLGGSLIQNTTLTNSTFDLNINSTTVPALTLQRSTAGFTLDVNPIGTIAQAIIAQSTVSGFLQPVVDVFCQSGLTTGSQAIGASGCFNIENPISPISTVPAVYIASRSSTASGAINSIALRVGNLYNGTVGSGIGIEFGNSDQTAGPQAYITNRIISKTSNNTNQSQMASTFVIQGKPNGVTNPIDQLTLKSTSQLKLNAYGIGTFSGVPTYNLSTTGTGDVIETTAGLFGTAFRGYISPPNINFVTKNLVNSNISSGIDVIFNSSNGVIEYQLVNGVTTSQYNQTTGIWTCPQTGKYDINYNVYLTAPSGLTHGWGQNPGTFTIGVTDQTGIAIIYCADVISFIHNQFYSKIYLTGGIQGKELTVGTQLKLKIQNMTDINYVEQVSLGDNIDWAIRRVG